MSAALGVTAIVLLVPGLGASLAAHRPGEVGLATRLALVAVMGAAVAGVVSFVLAILTILDPVPFYLVLGVVSAGLWAHAVRRDGLRAHWETAAAEFRQDPWALGAGLAVVVAIAIVRLTFSPLLHFGNSTSWRYWADGLEVADAGRIPPQSLQYGRLLPPTTNKVVMTTLSAGLSFGTGSEPVPALGAILWVASTGLAIALWSLGRELGLRFLAVLLPLLIVTNRVFLNHEMTGDMTTFKAEIVGRMIAFGALALAVRAIRDRTNRKDALVAGALFALAVGIHVVPVIVAGVILGWYVVARLALDRAFKPILLQSLLVAGVTAVIAFLVLFLPRGDLGLAGAAGNDTYETFAPGFDPTLYLNAGVLPGKVEVGPHTWDIAPGRALSSYVSTATGVRAKDAPRALTFLKYVLPLGGAVAAVAMLLCFPIGLRHVGVVAWGLGATLVGLTWAFPLRFELYIPAFFGVRRLFDYGSIPVVLMMLALAEAGLAVLGRVRAWAGAVALVAVSAAVLLPTVRPPSRALPADRAVAEAFTWIRQNLPCDARILPNEHTEGVFEALTGRVALLEGMTPYLRPDILQPIVELMLETRDFFHDPPEHTALLEREGVDYVVVIRSGGVGYRELIGAPALAELDRASFLSLRYDSTAMRVYEVTGLPATGTSFPDPASFPGYRCSRGPVGSWPAPARAGP